MRELMTSQNNITEGNILKTLIAFAVPFLIANTLQSLYGAVDLFVIGRYSAPRQLPLITLWST